MIGPPFSGGGSDGRDCDRLTDGFFYRYNYLCVLQTIGAE
ncbi:protein of unknown function [Kyrpidia spormannii]|uniref:Uncharacterized protein n=2 Tax=Kyrpidia spormannii TaxID=2055160 RepID=A0ACA8Z580_9BACL|nr:protein of unknown function [Kyrpidia spormannii]CAB3390336.1 protein of unknown function [Kyrpidia spormannii]